MDIRIFGVAGSPIADGNVESFLSASLRAVERPGVTVETASLAKLRVEDCRHCNFCWRKQTAGRYCVLDDDAQPLFEKAEAADVLVLASPVYVMRTSARMAAFIDRLRLFIFGSLTRNRLRNKVGVSLVVGWMRHAGVETTHLSHLLSFGILEMVPAICHESISPLGGSALSSENGWGRFDAAVRRGSQNDEHGLESARLSLERGIELATIIKRGTVAGAAPGIGGAAG